MNPGETTLPAASMMRAAGRVDPRRDARDRVAAHGDVAAIPRAAGAVDDAAVADHQVVGGRLRARGVATEGGDGDDERPARRFKDKRKPCAHAPQYMCELSDGRSAYARYAED